MARPTLKGPELAARLRLLRQKKGLTLEALAEKTGTTKGFLSQVERGSKAPSISTLMRIAETLDVTVADLFARRDQREPAYSLVRSHERQRYAREGTLYGYRYEAL